MLYVLKAHNEEKKGDTEDSNLLNVCSFFKAYDDKCTDDEEANIKLEETKKKLEEEFPSDDEKQGKIHKKNLDEDFKKDEEKRKKRRRNRNNPLNQKN